MQKPLPDTLRDASIRVSTDASSESLETYPKRQTSENPLPHRRR